MNKIYIRIDWTNSTTPALNETNLNRMSKAIDDLDDRVIEIAGTVMETIPQVIEALTDAQELEAKLEELVEKPPYIGDNGNWYVWDIDEEEYVDSGIDASITVQIADITMLAPDATPYVTNSGTNTDPVFHLYIPRGKGIASIAKTSTSGLVDTYTITYSDGYTTTFNVTNGKSAYQCAVEGGYPGTEAEFETDLSSFKIYANNAEESAEDSEAWAVGKRSGTDVPSTDPAYQNNSKYYAGQAASDAASALAYKNQASSSASDAQVAAASAAATESQIQTMIGMAEFTVNFTTGELEYTNDSTYNFEINTTTGNLEWEVVSA